MSQTYWGKPITGFGDIKSKILLVGLEPAAHGGIEQDVYLPEINPLIFYTNVSLRLKLPINLPRLIWMMD